MLRSPRFALPSALAALVVLSGCAAHSGSTLEGDVSATTPPVIAAPAAATAASDTARDARIARILGGLRPGVEVTNRPLVRWTLAERMAHYEVPGVSIAVIEGGQVAWARGVGVKQAGGADPVTPATLFQAASISKPIAQTAMLRLVEQGKLALDTNVNVYLTSWKVPDNEHTTVEKVTLRRIASHNAGLTVHGFPGYADGAAVPTVPQLLDGVAPANTKPVRVDTTPGAITRYSGGGTTVMQQVLVDATGRPFPDLMRELVLAPAGMTHSTYEQPLPASRAGEAARAHRRDGTPIPGGWHTYPEMAAAGLWTTPSDLASWALSIADARAGGSSALLSAETATAMLTEQKEGGSVGIGPSLSGSGRTFGFGHGGANAGFHSALIYYPELGTGAAVMTNGDGGPALLREVMAAMAAEYDWPGYRSRSIVAATLDSAAMSGMTGKYDIEVGPGLSGEITIEDGRLVLRAQRLQVQELIPQSPTQFTMSATGWKVEVARDASGRATGFTVDQGGGSKVEAVRAQ